MLGSTGIIIIIIAGIIIAVWLVHALGKACGRRLPVHKDHLSIETTVGWSMGHLKWTLLPSFLGQPVYRDH